MCFILQNFFSWKQELIPKLHVLKPKALLSIIVATMVIVGKVRVMYSGLKMLKTVINEVSFFLPGLTFTNIHDLKDKKGIGKLSKTSHGGQTFLTKNIWGGYCKWEY